MHEVVRPNMIAVFRSQSNARSVPRAYADPLGPRTLELSQSRLSSVVSLALSAPLAATAFRSVCRSHASQHLSAVQRSYDSRSAHIAGPTRSYRQPKVFASASNSDFALCGSVLAQNAAGAALVVRWARTNGATMNDHSAPHERDQCKLDDERDEDLCAIGSSTMTNEVSLGRLRQDQLVQSQIRYGLS